MTLLPGEIIVESPRESGRFVIGHTYSKETQIQPGQRLSPNTEFLRGCAAKNKLVVGAVTVRRLKGKEPRAFVKIGEPNIWRARALVVWERDNGPLPPGSVVHHRDRNSLNDVSENLVVMTRADHVKEHAADRFSAKRCRQIIESLRWIKRHALATNNLELLQEVDRLALGDVP